MIDLSFEDFNVERGCIELRPEGFDPIYAIGIKDVDPYGYGVYCIRNENENLEHYVPEMKKELESRGERVLHEQKYDNDCVIIVTGSSESAVATDYTFSKVI